MKRFALFTFTLCCAANVSNAEEFVVLAPDPAYGSQEGDVGGPAGAPFKAQYLHFASEFSSLPEGFTQLVGVSHRMYESEQGPAEVETDFIQVAVGTTHRNALDWNFRANYKSEPVIVFAGPLVQELGVSDDGPNPFFDPPIRFQTPFEYDPRTDGNLVIEFTSTTGTDTSYLIDVADTNSTTLVSSSDPYATTATFTGQVVLIHQFTFAPKPGDFNADGILDGSDINQLGWETADGMHNPDFDLTQDELVNEDDLRAWVKDIRKTWIGDANLDGEFNSTDLVAVFAAGKYQVELNAAWTEGDWTGDHRFDSADLVAAFQDGGYDQGPLEAIAALPEPSSITILMAGLVGVVSGSRTRWESLLRRRN